MEIPVISENDFPFHNHPLTLALGIILFSCLKKILSTYVLLPIISMYVKISEKHWANFDTVKYVGHLR